MAGICFFYEDSDVDVWSGHDLDAWNYACKVAGDIDSAIVINRTSQSLQPFDVLMSFDVVPDLASAEALMTGTLAYIVCPWNPGTHQSLGDCDHNVDWYVFGSASGWGDDPRDGWLIPQSGTGAVHSVHAATVVMFHRYWVRSVAP